jgi:hypothetical protein
MFKLNTAGVFGEWRTSGVRYQRQLTFLDCPASLYGMVILFVMGVSVGSVNEV